MARKPEWKPGGDHAPKPAPVEPVGIVLPTQAMLDRIIPPSPPATTISRSVTRSRADRATDVSHREYARAKAIKAFDEAFDCLMQIIRDKDASAQNKLRAAQLVIDLSMGSDETETETETFTSHLDALQGLAMRPSPKYLPTKKPPEGGSF